MSALHQDENEEWVTSRIESWVETYKKAMLTPVILRLVATHQPVTVAALTNFLVAATGWQVTERGLYRTVKRLQDAGFLNGENIDAPRTGAKRKELTLSPLGGQFLAGIDTNLIQLPTNRSPAE
ncbi:helix-turn-helix transcriptional regulator [uncultured Ornithinimicrobium sp.]|uniref:helix-turn-helix transcriptional regulator n=1 Tax=uncultured Ornithinimicrobium sp. TaxID=259307 RepID=UPI0025930D30|nr:helix-turn-helix transcriptional regulator [uncultured Ornithinimicrobium sp.]